MFIETVNNMGYQATRMDPFSQDFVKKAGPLGRKNKFSLEVGCGLGITAIAALEEGAILHGNDLASEHLEIVMGQLSEEKRQNFHSSPGDFRTINLPSNYFDVILCSRVLHFFTGNEVVASIQKLRTLLKTGGKLYLTVETPFLGNWKKFCPVYLQNKKAGKSWPGLVTSVIENEASGRSAKLPTVMHFFDIDTMARVLSENGFAIEKIAYIDRANSFPEDLLLDGRESLGVIAEKL